MFKNQYVQERIKKVNSLRELGINPYPTAIKKGLPSKKFLEQNRYLLEKEDGEREDRSKGFRLTGRVKFVRIMGKASFAKIEDSDV